MQYLTFSSDINASPEKIWQVLWEDATYRQWTSAFSEGSYAISDWKEKSKVHFLSPSGEGMFSEIDQLVPNAFMSFRHLGVVRNGEEQPQDEETRKWSGAMENYTLERMGDGTRLTVEIDITDDHAQYFQDTFPKALALVKSIAEN